MDVEVERIPAFQCSPIKVLGRHLNGFNDIVGKTTDNLDESELSAITSGGLQPTLRSAVEGSPVKGRPGSPARDLMSDESVGRRDWMPPASPPASTPASPPASPPPESEDEIHESEIGIDHDYEELTNDKQSLLNQLSQLTESNESLQFHNSLLSQKAEGLAAALDAEKRLNSHNSSTTSPSRSQLERSIHLDYKNHIEQMKSRIVSLSIDLVCFIFLSL